MTTDNVSDEQPPVQESMQMVDDGSSDDGASWTSASDTFRGSDPDDMLGVRHEEQDDDVQSSSEGSSVNQEGQEQLNVYRHIERKAIDHQRQSYAAFERLLNALDVQLHSGLKMNGRTTQTADRVKLTKMQQTGMERTLSALRVQLAKTQQRSMETVVSLAARLDDVQKEVQEERRLKNKAKECGKSVAKQLEEVKKDAERKQTSHSALESHLHDVQKELQEERRLKHKAQENEKSIAKQLNDSKKEVEEKQTSHTALMTKLKSTEQSLTVAKKQYSTLAAIGKTNTERELCKILISFGKPFRFTTYNNKAITLLVSGHLTIEEYKKVEPMQHFYIEAVDDDGSFRLYAKTREPKPKTIYAGTWVHAGEGANARNAAMEKGKGNKFQMTLNKAGDCRYVVALNFSFLTSSDLDEALAYLLAGYGSANGPATSFSGRMGH